MRRFKIMGLCLVAAFVVTALGASSASAVLPEYQSCIANAAGAFNNNLCTIPAGGDPDYEIQKNVAAVAFAGVGGVGELKSASGTVKCTSSASTGKIKGEKTTEKTSVKYQGCELVGTGLKCSTKPTPVGEIKTEKIKGTLIYADAAKTVVGNLFEPEGATAFAKFKCGPFTIEVTGSVIGESTPKNVYQNTGNTVLAEGLTETCAGSGFQLWQQESGAGACHFLKNPGASWNVASEVITYAAAKKIKVAG
jgi:hypothetical protein